MSKGTRQTNLLSFFNKNSTDNFPKNISEKNFIESQVKNIINVEGNDAIDESDAQNCTNSKDILKIKPTKRRRVVISSDEENEDEEKNNGKIKKLENVLNIKELNISQLSNLEAYKKIEKKPKSCLGGFADSFIKSFCYEEDLNISDLPNTSLKDTNYLSNSVSKTLLKKSTYDNDNESLERFPHLDFEFLKPKKIRDSKKRLVSDPNYDPKTLFIPADFLSAQTPGHRQWWLLKAENFDTILFFKVGKFYELYHMDAVIAVECLNLTYMRGKYAHCGFPEIGYSRFADQLINRGYKVARVEQTETPHQLEERCKKSMVKDKVVRREICRITTAATRTYGVMDGTDDRENDGTAECEANYLMALTERVLESNENNDGKFCSCYGISFVDCSTGQFQLSQFIDDINGTSLRTLLAHNYPTQLLVEKSVLSAHTKLLLNSIVSDVPQQTLFSENEFLSSKTTIQKLSDNIYFGKELSNWPQIFQEKLIIDLNNLIFNENYDLAISSLGALLWYLKGCLIDVDLFTIKIFKIYQPPNLSLDNQTLHFAKESYWQNRRMILDGTSLLNLHILPAHILSVASASSSRRIRNTQYSFDSNIEKFSLLNTINKCVTGFGKRLLQFWVCSPSCDLNVLKERQEAVSVLLKTENNIVTFVNRALEILRKIPDLERLFQRIHAIGSKYRVDSHPEGRAQLFELEKYNQRKIKDLVLTLDGLTLVQKLCKLYSNNEYLQQSKLLQSCLGEKFPQMKEDMEHFNNAFSRTRALEDGVIVPNKGVDSDYDNIVKKVEECECELNNYLEEEKLKLKCSNIKYFGTGRNSYQIEIPEAISKKLGEDYTLLSQRKGFKRYSTKALENLKTLLFEAKNNLDLISIDITRRVFVDLDIRKDKWSKIVENIATFDCVLSLVRYAQTSGLKMCFPEFVTNAIKPFLEIRNGYHPSLISSSSSNSKTKTKNHATSSIINYIPNDCLLGIQENDQDNKDNFEQGESTMLLTGANMGGKSTLMRQVSSLVILAQIGSMVPADKMRLTPVDRIFCRIGANDKLSAGQSTFYVELAETNVILREATRHSLVLIDELGRGTSTHDGTAIAFAVLKHISTSIGCRTIFSTHYHAICKMISVDLTDNQKMYDWQKNIKLAHMASMVENENTEDPTEENITFLYTLTSGPALKSYGFFTAKVAGISVEIIRRAFAASNMLQSC